MRFKYYILLRYSSTGSHIFEIWIPMLLNLSLDIKLVHNSGDRRNLFNVISYKGFSIMIYQKYFTVWN